MGAARGGHGRPGPPLLRPPPADPERPLGSVRAQRRGPLASGRAEPLPRREPGPRGDRQHAAAPERPRAAAAPVLVDRARLQALRPARVGGPAPARALGAARCSGHLCFRRSPLRPPHGRLRGGRPRDDAALLRPGPLHPRRHLHDGRARDGVRRPRRGGVRPAAGQGRPRARRCRPPCASARRGSLMAALGLFVGFESRGRPARAGRAAARRRPGVGRGSRGLDRPRARTRWGRGRAWPRSSPARRWSRWPSGRSPPRARTSISGWARSATRRPSTRRSTSTSRRSVTRWRRGARFCRSPSAASS